MLNSNNNKKSGSLCALAMTGNISMSKIIKSLIPDSIMNCTIITPGDVLRRINGNVINDRLDYEFYSYDSELVLDLVTPDKKIKLVKINKPEGADLGIEFETYLMDKERSCANKCIFCFIDQLPAAMRETLCYKDDDVRLSFLQGNYVTLTNLSDDDIKRIIKLRISPINVSIHTLDPELRSYMLGGERGGKGIKAFKALAGAGITLNCQIVCCPGINDGWQLSKTIEGLIDLGPCINSVSIVPVGLTKHRQGLTKLKAFDKELALQTIKQVEFFGERCLKKRGSRVFYCADELYMLAELDLPENEFYEDYPQLENGVGMMRLFMTEFEEALQSHAKTDSSNHTITHNETQLSEQPFYSIVTGTLAHNYLTNLLKTATEKYGTIKCNVHPILNEFFGESITVSGLITGHDIITQLKDKDLGEKLLIPQNMLRNMGSTADGSPHQVDEGIFLDGMTVSELSNALGIPVYILKQNGTDLLKLVSGK